MNDATSSEIEITADNFADLLPAEPDPLDDSGAVQEPAEPTAEDVSDDEILALEATEVDGDDTLTDDAADWDEAAGSEEPDDDPNAADDASSSAS